MEEDDYNEELPPEETPVEDQNEDLVESDEMSDAEGGFKEGAESDKDLLSDKKKRKANVDDDEVMED